MNKQASFGSPAILFKLINSRAWSTQITVRWNLILLVKTPIIFKSLNGVCKQNTFTNVKWDKRCRENTTDILYKQSDIVLNTFQMKTNRDIYTKEDEVLTKF